MRLVLRKLSLRFLTWFAVLIAISLEGGQLEVVASSVTSEGVFELTTLGSPQNTNSQETESGDDVDPAIATRTPSASPIACLKRFVQECVRIRPGEDAFPAEFKFGSTFQNAAKIPLKSVRLNQSFRINRYETTQELYQVVMAQNPSRWKGPRNSVESMKFSEAQLFCAKLTARLRAEKLIASNEVVRLPTEYEWEYCCRAGTATQYSFGDSAIAGSDKGNQASLLDPYAWHTGNAAGNDPAVGVLKPNNWGLYDTHGYLWEFVSDDAMLHSRKGYSDAKSEGAEMPAVIVRGGAWTDHFSRLVSSSRMAVGPDTASDAIGFRCVIAEKPMAEK